MSYAKKLKDPRWKEKRERVIKLFGRTCCGCRKNKKKVNVHHLKYINDPWDVEDSDLIVLCEDCHKEIHAAGEITKIVDKGVIYINEFIKTNTLLLLKSLKSIENYNGLWYLEFRNNLPYHIVPEICYHLKQYIQYDDRNIYIRSGGIEVDVYNYFTTDDVPEFYEKYFKSNEEGS